MKQRILLLLPIMLTSICWAEYHSDDHIHQLLSSNHGKSHHSTTQKGEAMEGMPMIKPKRIYRVTGNENFISIMGYGNNESMVSMMNLMMVEGSGMEGMEMEPMQLKFDEEDPLDFKSMMKSSRKINTKLNNFQ